MMTAGQKKVTIIIADPQYLTGFALVQLLKEKYDISVFNDTHRLVEWFRIKQSDLLIIDPSIADIEEKHFIKELEKKVRHIIILANEISKPDFIKYSALGIESFLLKSADSDEINHCINLCLKNKKYYPEEILQFIMGSNATKNTHTGFCQLTATEMEIVKSIAEGLTTKQIAAKKIISFHTVISHRKNIFRKAEVNSVSELIIYAIKAGWIDNIEYYI
jgi:DNA-binding NarL/FixJ family response regulator